VSSERESAVDLAQTEAPVSEAALSEEPVSEAPVCEAEPEKLPPSAKLTLGLFAAFVLGTTGCFINLFLH
jgi:hypothetical protein